MFAYSKYPIAVSYLCILIYVILTATVWSAYDYYFCFRGKKI